MLLSFHANAAHLKPSMQRSSSSSSGNSRLRRCASVAAAGSAPLSPLWSTDEPPPPPPNDTDASSSRAGSMSQRPWHIKTLSAINESTKWTVSATVLAVLLWQHNEYAAWCVVGAVLSSFLCKVLKHVLNHARPDSAPKSDPGMPSSHANSLNFLSVYAALSLAYHTHNSPGALVLAAVAVGLGVFKTWLRVYLGFHTWPQVLVGAALGATTAVSWFKLGTSWALPALKQSATGLGLLYAVTCLGSAAFGFKIISGWFKERKQGHKQAGANGSIQQGRSVGAEGDEQEVLLQQQQQVPSQALLELSQGRQQPANGAATAPAVQAGSLPAWQ